MSAYLLNAAGATDPLARMASGEYRVGIAFSDVIGSRKGQIAEADSKLTGQSLFALDATADAYLIGLSDGRVFMIEASEVTRSSLSTIDVTQSVCELSFDQSPACLVSSDPELVRQTIFEGALSKLPTPWAPHNTCWIRPWRIHLIVSSSTG